MELSRKRIIAAAIELIESEGVEAASMRRLATTLGCGVMSLYSYVPSVGALLDGVTDEVMSGIARVCLPHASWPDQLRAQARGFRQIAAAHPRCAMLAASRPPVSPGTLRPAESALATLREAGFSGSDAVLIVRALATYILGSLLREAGIAPGLTAGDDRDGAGPGPRPGPRPAEFPQLANLRQELRAREPDSDFEFGLDLLMRAVMARVS